MLLAIDIGNSYTKFGIFESSSLVDKFAVPTMRDYTVDELQFSRLQRIGERFVRYDSVFISSVVPELDRTVENAMFRLLNVEPRFIDHTFNFGINVNYDPPEAAGIDRLVNASSAAARYGTPVIACSFGTATTVDVVNGRLEYLGGAIAPGMRTMAEALHLKTSKLPLVTPGEPAAAIGRTTEDSIRSGVYNGYLGLVEGLITRVIKELGETPKVIATGGFAKTVAAASKMIDTVDEDLTLEGIRLIAERRH